MVIMETQDKMDNFCTLEVAGWDAAIFGMRAPLKSYDRNDSETVYEDNDFYNFTLGPNDYKLAKSLCQAGAEHRKWMRQIQVWVKISMPLYWWSEFDTYKIGTSANSESTMHTISKRELALDDFDTKYMSKEGIDNLFEYIENYLNVTLSHYNSCKYCYSIDKNPEELPYIEQVFTDIKSLLPASFIQTRYVNLNYEVLHNMYHQRKNHRLPQWSNDFVSWVKTLPYSEFITEEFE